ncbi:peptide-methionine (S)-S-oxide reductase MsrA [Phnomibacter sp. MR]|jgi:peptide-methionine (S)-S-oxide reductase|uniref:peptide-methionine (S)-S-oxide reductase MsrA n=1 Tax=Phnomibacter sp. MR TaxID=3042318 RepID=UPI003A80CDF6
MMNVLVLATVAGGLMLAGCNQPNVQSQSLSVSMLNRTMETTDTATFGAGCFWCTEAVFQELKGVLKVTSGYSGGHVANPTYEQVTSKTTGHAEVTQIVYNPEQISFDELLEVFWKTHDPTTPNRQGADVGPQYRSAIFYHSPSQKELAEKYKADLDKSGAFDAPIVTEISPYKNFYSAEDYHQNFYTNNPNYGYCTYVIKPKLDKFRKVFQEKLRKTNPGQ